MSESIKQFTSEQLKIFDEAVEDAGINTQPWWEVVPYSGPTKVLHAGLFRKSGWFSKVLIAVHDDLNKLKWLSRYIKHTGWTLSCEMGQFELSRGDFIILQRSAFRGGNKKLVIDRLCNLGVDKEFIEQSLNSQMEEVQAYAEKKLVSRIEKI